MIGDFLQPTHLIFVLLVALVFLGPKRLPEVGKALGKGLRDFKGAMNGIEEQSRDIFDTKHDDAQRHEPEPVMATSTSSDEPAMAGAATQQSPAVAPRVDESSSVV